MKKLYIFLLFSIGISGFSQKSDKMDYRLSPGGFLENIFDQYGNKYALSDLRIEADKKTGKGEILKNTPSCSSGIFDLYFENNSGMEDTTNPAHNARRAVLCQVFNDLSNFINSPLKNAGNTQRVNIWVRDITQIPNVPSNVLGLATSFYNMPSHANTGFGGIADNEIWKTIQSGKNSYINVSAPIVSNPSNSNAFYHGMMAFNFNSVNWNTNLNTNSPTGLYDLYTVVLHEVTHALGFASLMNQNGTSVFGNGYNYFSRYDRFLKNNGETQPLITNSTACSMYNYSFNTANLTTSVLHPSAGCQTNQTNCSSALKFVGTSTTPIYTPNCFEDGSSLSHFEDLCVAPNANDAYFVMSNATSDGTGINTVNTKRFLKFQERNALADIGYSLNSTYGNNSTAYGSYNNYGGAASSGITVVGINDGISTNATFAYIGNTNTSIAISGILSNDYNAVGFECLQDVYSTATFSATSGNASTALSLVTTSPGLHLLRYVPINATGQKGNITYIYVYVYEQSHCAPTSCNLVMNGDFEQYHSLPTGAGYIANACGWMGTNNASPDYFHVNSPNTMVRIPCNFSGYQNSNNSIGSAYASFVNWNQNGYQYSESMVTKLAMPLQPRTTYQLSFDVSLHEGASSFTNKLQAYLSVPLLPIGANPGDILIANPSMLFTNPTFSSNFNGWERITFTITTGDVAGEQYLYLGGLQNVQIGTNTAAINNTGCAYNDLNSSGWSSYHHSGYYIDNVELTISNNASLNLPASVCSNETLSDLSEFLTGTPPGGVFSGSGVTASGNTYSFSAGLGVHTITYTYTNSSGCEISLTDSITVNTTNAQTPSFNSVPPICYSEYLAELPTTSLNNPAITGFWSPAIDNTATTTYTFYPDSGQCASSTTLTITVLPPNDPACAPCQSTLTLSAPESNSTIAYQLGQWIETNNSYSVGYNQDITMKAGDYVYLKPNTFIQYGASYVARIQGCDMEKSSAKEDLAFSNAITVYPNPTNDVVTISTGKINIKSILITSMEGKTVYADNSINRNSFLLNAANYQNGIYIITIETNDGQITREKLIKN